MGVCGPLFTRLKPLLFNRSFFELHFSQLFVTKQRQPYTDVGPTTHYCIQQYQISFPKRTGPKLPKSTLPFPRGYHDHFRQMLKFIEEFTRAKPDCFEYAFNLSKVRGGRGTSLSSPMRADPGVTDVFVASGGGEFLPHEENALQRSRPSEQGTTFALLRPPVHEAPAEESSGKITIKAPKYKEPGGFSARPPVKPGTAANYSPEKPLHVIQDIYAINESGVTARNQDNRNKRNHDDDEQAMAIDANTRSIEATKVMERRQKLLANLHLRGHLKETMMDFCPIYAFWLFTFERYIAVLGEISTNKADSN
ncbi:uncharacterized protein BYT42DRAFT_610119 [Radiomyces spectabilis]|uniref:uncharacterized protein n=1 Tax=Radiomyces spectabilis TaxID=64574 RepID=UPI0022211996|nr:uncharacterized protein BYT42DRAFT_610119 [Radiomyces spectabilis]KAI8390843.1 hypothetical protein BYT42DRAFT_610119 [Radiomyces spectabilis]